MNYGLPYQGSKSKIAEWVVSFFPQAKHFVDLFAGGCSVTHRAMMENRWADYTVNDIGDAPRLFVDAVEGKYKNETRWISREDFLSLKDTDPYVRICWSFGNNGRAYLYSREIEPWKKALHFARVFGDNTLFEKFGIKSDGSSRDIVKNKEKYKELYVRWYCKTVWGDEDVAQKYENLKDDIAKNEELLRNYLLDALKASGLTQAEVQRRLGTQMARHYFCRSQWQFPTREYYEQMQTFMPLPQSYNEIYGLQELLRRLERLQSLEHLERLERLQSLQSLQSLEHLERLQMDYREVPIEKNSVVYCDIPYKETAGYLMDFDHEAFYDWAERQSELVIISEYGMPDDRFYCIGAKSKNKLFSCTGVSGKALEKLYIPKHQEQLYKLMANRLFI